jgi:hypothetical protein
MMSMFVASAPPPAVVMVILVLLLVLRPRRCRAWGPATHLQLGIEVLAAKEALPIPVALRLAQFPYDFLYGNIAADIIVGKRFVHPLRHCHSWNVGFDLLRQAATPAQQAFGYGYLAHLAADIVAHNDYVPTMMVRHCRTRGAVHLGWEIRFDVSNSPKLWRYAHLISRRVRWNNDPLLARALTPTIFSFPVNRRIFNTILLLNRVRRWQRLMGRMEFSARWPLSVEEIATYRDRARANMLAILTDLEASPLCAADPRGERALMDARRRARQRRRQP